MNSVCCISQLNSSIIAGHYFSIHKGIFLDLRKLKDFEQKGVQGNQVQPPFNDIRQSRNNRCCPPSITDFMQSILFPWNFDNF